MWDALHGRRREVEELAIYARGVRQSAGRAVVLAGPAGIGKSRLLAEGIEQAAQAGLTVLRARASEADRTVPYWILRQLADSRREGAGRSANHVTVPDGPVKDEMAAALRWYWYLADLASTGPLALCIDDLHWVDEASFRALEALRVRLSDVPIMLLVATRELPSAWAADSAVTQIPVRPLEANSVTAILESILGSAEPGLVQACMDVTRGNPLLVREVGRSLRAAGHGGDVSPSFVRAIVPETIVVSTHARLASFGREAVALAEALALLGNGHDVAPVAALADVSMEEAATAVDRLVANELFEEGRPLAFQHPLLLAAVRDAMAASRRSQLQLRAMRLFREMPGSLDRASAHALLVDPAGSAEVLSVLREGAASALERAAPHTAVAYLRRALAEPPSPDDEPAVLRELAAAACAAQEPDALDLAQLALDRSPDAIASLQAALGVSHLLTMSGRGREAAELLARKLDADGIPAELKDAAFGVLAISSASSIDARESVRLKLADLATMAAEPTSTVQVRAVAAVELAVASGSAAEAGEMARRAWGDGELLRQTGADQPFVHSVALAVAVAGDIELLETMGSALTGAATQTGSLLSRLIAVVWPAWVCETRGDLAGSEAYARECIELSARAGIPIATSIPVVVLANASLARSGPDAAAKALELVPPVARNPDLITTPMYWLARAAVNCQLGRYAQVLADVRDVQRWQRRWPAEQGGWTFWEPFAVEAHLARGDCERAHEVAMTGLHRARAFGARRPIVDALRALALTSPADERGSLLTEAIELAALGGCGADGAKLRLLRAAGQGGAEARDDLHDALGICDQTGAGHVGSQVLGALAELGARPRRAAVSGILSLTPAERRVVDLAGSGATNRVIAETLFLTEKTVETHLTHAYRKLEVRSRAQLASILEAQ